MTYLASAYLDGHLKPLLGQTLDVQQAVAANVSGRLQGSDGHLLVVRLRIAMSVLVWLLAIAGAVRATRRGAASPESPDPRAGAGDARRAAALWRGDADARLPVLAAVRGLLRRTRARARTRPATVAAAPRARGSRRACWSRASSSPATATSGPRCSPPPRCAPSTGCTRSRRRARCCSQRRRTCPWKQRHYADYRYQLLSRQLQFAGPPPSSPELAAAVARYMQRNQHRRPPT